MPGRAEIGQCFACVRYLNVGHADRLLHGHLTYNGRRAALNRIRDEAVPIH